MIVESRFYVLLRPDLTKIWEEEENYVRGLRELGRTCEGCGAPPQTPDYPKCAYCGRWWPSHSFNG